MSLHTNTGSLRNASFHPQAATLILYPECCAHTAERGLCLQMLWSNYCFSLCFLPALSSHVVQWENKCHTKGAVWQHVYSSEDLETLQKTCSCNRFHTTSTTKMHAEGNSFIHSTAPAESSLSETAQKVQATCSALPLILSGCALCQVS